MAQHFRKILHATDYSKASARALDEAVALAKQNRAELLVLHVIDSVTPYVTGEDIGGAELYMKLEETNKHCSNSRTRSSLKAPSACQSRLIYPGKTNRTKRWRRRLNALEASMCW